MTSPPSAPAAPADRPVVLVTGAARRIGRSIAEHLARCGWSLALHANRSVQECQALADALRAQGAHAIAVQADLDDERQTEQLGPTVLQAFGRWDAVVNNASRFEYDHADSFSYAALERHWKANTAAPIVLARALHRHLKSASSAPHPAGRARGCVVNLLDQKLWNPNPDYLSYTLSKAALEAAGTLMAQAFAPELRVCGVAPGVTLISGPDMTEAGFQQAHTLTPLGRSSTPQDIARAVAFLLESDAITGTTLLVDGGQHLARQPRDVLFLTDAPAGASASSTPDGGSPP